MQLFVVKCGLTDYDGTLIGRANPELNEAGEAYAGQIADELKTIPMDDMYTSRLARAERVGKEIFYRQNNKDTGLIIHDSLIDMDYGTLTGEAETNADAIYHRAEPFMRYPRGESYMDIVARVYPFVEMLKQKYSVHDRIAVITHEPIMQIIEVYCNGMDAMGFIYGRKQFDPIVRYDL